MQSTIYADLSLMRTKKKDEMQNKNVTFNETNYDPKTLIFRVS